jgi:hypothetical protein
VDAGQELGRLAAVERARKEEVLNTDRQHDRPGIRAGISRKPVRMFVDVLKLTQLRTGTICCASARAG